MASRRVADQALRDPSEDLLGMCEYARELAQLLSGVELPFTVGVYGEWGAGKTSLIQLLRNFLCVPAHGQNSPFVEFSAWPYRTSDELWRALVLTIAKHLCDLAEKAALAPAAVAPAAVAPAAPTALQKLCAQIRRVAGLEGALASVGEFLEGAALVLRDDPPPPTVRSRYEELVERLDHTPYGTIGKNPRQGARLDPEETTLALVKGALTALGSVSPLIAGVRGFLGLGENVEMSALIAKQNEAVRERIESVAQFRSIFDTLFKDFQETAPDGTRRVCLIFIDDLDRCMPDVALDILEAIKIFPENAPCIFLVAADQQLIGQGLRLRYKELLEKDGRDTDAAFLARKGQEYFEKIIQLAIRVPYRTDAQTHRLIAAQFPEWVAATDLIRVAVGDNPRRVKQYCHWLAYHFSVAAPQLPRSIAPLDESTRELLEALLALGAWDAPSLGPLRSLTRDAQDNGASCKALIDALKQVQSDPSQAGSIHLDNPDSQKLFEYAKQRGPLRDLWCGEVDFSARWAEVGALVELADIQPDPDNILRSRDALFVRVLERYNATGSVEKQSVLKDDLNRLFDLQRKFPAVLPLLLELAGKEDWSARLQGLESLLQKRESLTKEYPDFDTLIERAADKAGAQAADPKEARKEATKESDALRTVLLDEPRLSRMLPDVVRAFDRVLLTLPESAVLDVRRVADELASGAIAPEFRDAIERGLRLRIEAAIHCRTLRTFAKVMALSYGWPEFVPKLLRGDIRDLEDLESQLLPPKPGSLSGSTGRWEQYRSDERLTQLLRLRPFFREIFKDEYRPILKVQQLVTASSEPNPELQAGVQPPPSAMASTPKMPAAKSSAPPPAATAPDAEILSAQEMPWEEIHLKVEIIDNASSGACKLTLAHPNPDERIEVEVQPDWAALKRAIETLRKFPRLLEEVARTRNLSIAAEPILGAQLREPGQIVFDCFFQKEARTKFEGILKQGEKNYRIRLELRGDVPAEMPDVNLRQIPWECLYVPGLRLSIGLAPRCSLVRVVPDQKQERLRMLRPPLRVLVVMPEPKDRPRLSYAEEELKVLERTLAGGTATIEALVGERATPANFQSALRRFKPHVFHFVGHGNFDTVNNRGQLLFQNESGTSEFMLADDLSTLLTDRAVSVAFLNGCDTGTASVNDGLTGVAGAVVGAGVPVAIATLREVSDEAALIFSREFYRCLADGVCVETSVVEARKALSLTRWNWSAYAVFTSRNDLHQLRLLTQPERRVVPALELA